MSRLLVVYAGCGFVWVCGFLLGARIGRHGHACPYTAADVARITHNAAALASKETANRFAKLERELRGELSATRIANITLASRAEQAELDAARARKQAT